MCNNLAAIFYLMGMMPFFIFAPKYLEVMFAQTAAFANLISGNIINQKVNSITANFFFTNFNLTSNVMFSGTVGLACSAIGILLSGVVLTKYKPKARSLAAWNVFCGFTMVIGVVIFTFLECPNGLGEKSFYGMAK